MFPVRVASEDWASGDTVRLLDIIGEAWARCKLLMVNFDTVESNARSLGDEAIRDERGI